MTALKAERLKRGWSLEYLGQLLGISKSAVQRIESGTRQPSYSVLCKLEDLFQMPHRELLAQSGEAEDKSS